MLGSKLQTYLRYMLQLESILIHQIDTLPQVASLVQLCMLSEQLCMLAESTTQPPSHLPQ